MEESWSWQVEILRLRWRSAQDDGVRLIRKQTERAQEAVCFGRIDSLFGGDNQDLIEAVADEEDVFAGDLAGRQTELDCLARMAGDADASFFKERALGVVHRTILRTLEDIADFLGVVELLVIGVADQIGVLLGGDDIRVDVHRIAAGPQRAAGLFRFSR